MSPAIPLPLLIHAVGSVGIFASRAFLPSFATALVLRFGPRIPWLSGLGLLPYVQGVPTWFTSDEALAILGLLSALELVAERVPEARVAPGIARDLIRVAMAALTFLGVLSATDLAALHGVVGDPGLLGDLGLLGPVGALAVGVGTLGGARARRSVVAPLREADEDDDLGAQGLLAWVEDLWGALGPLALIVLPMLTVAALGVAALLLLVIGRRIDARESASAIPCAKCVRPMPAAAPSCPHCRARAYAPRDVGLLGRTLDRPADPETHPFRLVAARRCPSCASRLSRRAVVQDCPACGHPVLADPAFTRAYLGYLDRRVPPVLLCCALMGLVPVLGVIPGVITYRLALIAPLRRYLPPGRGLALRWAVRLTILLLVAFQWVPVAGALALPAMALISYAAYRGVFRNLALGAP